MQNIMNVIYEIGKRRVLVFHRSVVELMVLLSLMPKYNLAILFMCLFKPTEKKQKKTNAQIQTMKICLKSFNKGQISGRNTHRFLHVSIYFYRNGKNV